MCWPDGKFRGKMQRILRNSFLGRLADSQSWKGEAFVPENIVLIGSRAAGRDGVKTIKAEDERIKYQGLHHGSSYLEHLHFLSAVKAQAKNVVGIIPVVELNDGLLSVAIGVAGQLSIERGRFVDIEEVLSQQ